MAMVKMTPDVLSCSDDKGNMEIQINLPGVKKEDIELKMVAEGFFIRAKREETGVEYAGTYAFWCPVVPQKAVARYCEGKLIVIVPYLESSEVVNVEIQ